MSKACFEGGGILFGLLNPHQKAVEVDFEKICNNAFLLKEHPFGFHIHLDEPELFDTERHIYFLPDRYRAEEGSYASMLTVIRHVGTYPDSVGIRYLRTYGLPYEGYFEIGTPDGSFITGPFNVNRGGVSGHGGRVLNEAFQFLSNYYGVPVETMELEFHDWFARQQTLVRNLRAFARERRNVLAA